MDLVTGGHIPYASLYDGSMDLHQLALLRDALAVQAENERRYRKAMEKK